MILRIAQGLRRSDDDTLAGMDSQWVKVLHVTDGNTVVVAVANHLVLYLLPSLQTLLYQYLWREREGLLCELVQLLLVISETRTESTQCIGSTDDDRITQLGSSLAGLLDVLASLALDGLHVDFIKLLDEELAVLGIHDGLYRSTQHLDVIFLQDTLAIEFHTTVEGSLTTETKEDSVWLLLLDDTLYEVGLHRQEVNLVGNAFRSLYGCNIRVDEHGLDTFLAQSLQRLRTRVVELACLTYLQGS